MKLLAALSFCSLMLVAGCSKDKNMEDYRREQLGQSLSRISSVSGSYSGSVISKIDGTNLGNLTLKFQARTDIQSGTGNVASTQSATVSGSLGFNSLTKAEVVFDNGFYDDVTGDFQVTIPITQEGGGSSKLFLIGVVRGDSWLGSIEVKGQQEYGGELSLVKNAPPSNTSSVEVGGTRLQQIKKMNYSYLGSYNHEAGGTIPLKMTFVNRDLYPEQNFFKLFSPVRNVGVHFDFSDFELIFNNAILDDNAGTIVGQSPVNQRGTPVRANLNCLRFEANNGDFGWNCTIQTKTLIKTRLTAKQ